MFRYLRVNVLVRKESDEDDDRQRHAEHKKKNGAHLGFLRMNDDPDYGVW
jgi:hypothetical protein